jgi:hypothetical protein
VSVLGAVTVCGCACVMGLLGWPVDNLGRANGRRGRLRGPRRLQ